MRYRPSLGCVLLVLAVLLFSTQAIGAKKRKGPDFGPGPTVMSEEEKAISEDPAAGIEHAVILVEETERNEDLGADMETKFHARIKILSNEARDLANIEIPFIAKDGSLTEWWGRTILPDGTVLELKEEELEEQSVARTRGKEAKALKAALPGVVPGCVIDYGYKLREIGYYPFSRISLQRRYQMLEFRFRWIPTNSFKGAYILSRTEGLDVTTERDKQHVFVSGSNLHPVVEEPMMPPDPAVRAALILYYLPSYADFDEYWDEMAKGSVMYLKGSTGKKGSIQQLIGEMGLPAGGSLDERLRAAYDWVGSNITRTGLRTYEEIETEKSDDKDKNKRDVAAKLLEQRKGTMAEIQRMFIGVARALGAEADLVWVADRTENFFDPNLRTLRQFESTLVAVRPKGTPEKNSVLLDPGSGLPYGHIPWWYTGIHGMLFAKSGPHVIEMFSKDIQDNGFDAHVKVSFSEDNETLLHDWNLAGRGQYGLSERRRLRRLEPEERNKRIDRLCGAGPETDIISAEVIALDETGRDLELQCETESWETGLEEETTHYSMEWGGPWLRTLPDLPDKPRVHPIIFAYPRTDTATLEIETPEGFVLSKLPSPVNIKSELGKYTLRFSRTESGLKVERTLAFYPLGLPPTMCPTLRRFIERVGRGDRTPVLFTRGEAEQ